MTLIDLKNKDHFIKKSNNPINQGGFIMKRFKLNPSIFVVVVMLVFGMMVGCEQQSPVDPFEEASDRLQFVELEKGGVPFTKMVTETDTVSPDDGGMIDLEYLRGVAQGVRMTFQVLPNSIPDSSAITLGLDTKIIGSSVDMTFGPSGTKFDPYALLNIETKGLNLNNVNVETLAFYYVDSNDELVEMPCDDIQVDVRAGVIKVINAKVPHFSRYAIAFSK